MAKKIQFHVSFAMTIGVSTEVEKGIEQMREELRKEVEKVGIEVVLARGENGHSMIRRMLNLEATTEEVLVDMARTGCRGQLEALREDRKDGNFQRIGDISINQVNKSVRVKVSSSCQGCVETNCMKPESHINSGCSEKTVGFRSPHFETRFEKTV